MCTAKKNQGAHICEKINKLGEKQKKRRRPILCIVGKTKEEIVLDLMVLLDGMKFGPGRDLTIKKWF